MPALVNTRPPEKLIVSLWNWSQADASVLSVIAVPSMVCHAPEPLSHVSVNTAAWQDGAQLLPQAPQLPTSADRSCSQPLPAFPSQSPKPAAQVGEPQVPAWQTPWALGSGQLVPSATVTVRQPSIGSQLAAM